jgi:hypothetical protein
MNKITVLHSYTDNAPFEIELELQNQIAELATIKGCLIRRINMGSKGYIKFAKWKSQHVIGESRKPIWVTKGIPDLELLTPEGITIAIDVKMPNSAKTPDKLLKSLRKEQAVYLVEVANRKGFGVVCNSFTEFNKFINGSQVLWEKE